MILLPPNHLVPLADGQPAMTLVLGMPPVLVVLGLVLGLCIVIVIAALVARRSHPTRRPGIVVSARGTPAGRRAAGGTR